MNSSQFMDKQILGLSASASGTQSLSSTDGGAGELFDLMNPQEDNHHINGGGGGGVGMIKKEEILPSYDFQPIRAIGSSSAPTAAGFSGSGAGSGSSSWPSLDSKIASSSLRSAGILEANELTKVSHEKNSTYDATTVAEVDRTVKRHVDNLLHALEGVSSRLSQLESRTHLLENTVDELKATIGDNNGSTDGKLRQLENILREVQNGVQVLRDKQEIMGTQLHISKPQASEAGHKQPDNSNAGLSEHQAQQVSPPQQLVQQPYQQPTTPGQSSVLSALPTPNAPPPPLAQQNPPHFSSQLTAPQIPSVPPLPRQSYFPSPAQATEASHQYHASVGQPQQPPPLPPPTHYQSAPQLPQYHQPPQPQHVNPSPQLQPPVPQHPEESAPYIPASQTYPSSIRQPAPFPQPFSGPVQQFFGPNPSMYEPPANKLTSARPPFSSGYGSPMGPSFSEANPYGGAPSRHSSSAVKPQPFSSGAASSGGSGNYPRLPTAQILPQALPTATDSGASSGTRVPMDDVVEKVATMGFSRDVVRATVRKLTENGQSVDLNVVLDKLMNDGEIQPQKGWFGR